MDFPQSCLISQRMGNARGSEVEPGGLISWLDPETYQSSPTSSVFIWIIEEMMVFSPKGCCGK